MNELHKKILDYLPYKSSFRFVDEICSIDDNEVTGRCTLRKDAFFYRDHFVGYPVTPGVIIIEIMAQIGLVVPGIYHLMQSFGEDYDKEKLFPLLTSTAAEFYKMVLPGETVEVHSKKEYFRLNKLKCFVEMFNSGKELVAKGHLAGIIKIKE